jgi:hypothetical protein
MDLNIFGCIELEVEWLAWKIISEIYSTNILTISSILRLTMG